METLTLTLKQSGPRTAYLVTQHDNPLLKVEPASSAGAADFDGLAARLVRAVNAHDELVAALRELLVVATHMLPDYIATCRADVRRSGQARRDFDPALLPIVKSVRAAEEVARAVLAKAEGREL